MLVHVLLDLDAHNRRRHTAHCDTPISHTLSITNKVLKYRRNRRPRPRPSSSPSLDPNTNP
jgi:hypothetical protein